jgi:hypothetical protein
MSPGPAPTAGTHWPCDEIVTAGATIYERPLLRENAMGEAIVFGEAAGATQSVQSSLY